jgi:2-C-methyl-D-erythritol 4-phosphate cytidylyltransferase
MKVVKKKIFDHMLECPLFEFSVGALLVQRSALPIYICLNKDEIRFLKYLSIASR